MKSLIKKILKENFDWVLDIPSYEDMRIDWMDHVVPYLTGKKPTVDEDGDVNDFEDWSPISDNETNMLEPMVKHYFLNQFNDVEFKDGKFILSVRGWSEFVPLFKQCDYQGYICQNLAQSILSEDGDFWEPFHDIVYDFEDEVWDLLTKESIMLIINHMKTKYIGVIIDYDDNVNVEITEKLLDSFVNDTDELGKIINDNSTLSDLKNNLQWWMEDSYNQASRDEYWSSANGAITDVFGEGTWENYEVIRNGNPTKTHQLTFNITSWFMDVIDTYFKEYCDLSYDYECELQYNSFLDNLNLIMSEDLYGELLNPSVSEWPDGSKVEKYFNERIREEL